MDTLKIAYAAGSDVANARVRARGNKPIDLLASANCYLENSTAGRWTRADYFAAIRELNRVMRAK